MRPMPVGDRAGESMSTNAVYVSVPAATPLRVAMGRAMEASSNDMRKERR